MRLYSDSIDRDDGFEEINNPTTQDIARVLGNVLTRDHDRGFYLQLDDKDRHLGLSSPLFCTAIQLDMIIDIEYVDRSPETALITTVPENKRAMLLHDKACYLQEGNEVLYAQVQQIDTIEEIITAFQQFLLGKDGWKNYFKLGSIKHAL